MRRSNLYGIVGTLALAVSMTTATMVVVDYLFNGPLALITATGMTLLAGWLWFGQPLLTRIRGASSVPRDEAPVDGSVGPDSGQG